MDLPALQLLLMKTGLGFQMEKLDVNVDFGFAILPTRKVMLDQLEISS